MPKYLNEEEAFGPAKSAPKYLDPFEAFGDEGPSDGKPGVLQSIKDFGTRFVDNEIAGLAAAKKRKQQEGYDRANAASQAMIAAQSNSLSPAEREQQNQAQSANQRFNHSTGGAVAELAGGGAHLIRDQGLGFVKGAVNTFVKLPLAVSGWAEDATDTRKTLEQVGYRSKDALSVASDFNKSLDSMKSDAGQKRDADFNATRGALDTLAAMGGNPAIVLDKVSEALAGIGMIGKTAEAVIVTAMPRIVAAAEAKGLTGAAAEKFTVDMATRIARVAAPAAEGLQTGLDISGTAQEAGRTLDQYGMPALVGGLVTAGIGIGANKLAAKAGIGDIETAIALRKFGPGGANTKAPGLSERVLLEGGKEGLLEEGPQSANETIAENMAMGRRFDEGLGKGVVTGMAAGFGMGGAHAAFSKPQNDSNGRTDGLGAGPVLPPNTPPINQGGQAVDASEVLGKPDTGGIGTTDTAAAEKALREPVGLTSLDRVDAIDTQIAQIQARKQELAQLQTPSTDTSAELTELEVSALDLQQERAKLTKEWPTIAPGNSTQFSTETGSRLDAQYALVDADQLVTSHDANLRANPAYPPELQPRERDRAASELQVSSIVGRLDPARLGVSADAATGAPIIGADGLVESGNARTIALKRVYQANGQKAADYKQFLSDNAAQFGITPESVQGMAKPVLVRVRSTPVNRAEFARLANAPTVAAMSPSEQAKSDASRIDVLDDLNPDENGDFAKSRDFIRRFVGKLPVTEQSSMLDASGQLSSTGYARVRNAVLSKAYGNSPVLARMVESMDDNLRNISKALMSAAPKVAQMRQAIGKGNRFDADITPDLVAAAEELSRLKDSGTSVADALAQAGMFGDKYSAETQQLIQFLADNIRRPRKMADFIVAYMDALDAAGDPNQGSLIGDVQAPTKTELLTAAKRGTNESEKQDSAPGADQNLERGDTGEGAAVGREGAEQSQNAPGNRSGNEGAGATGSATSGETRLSRGQDEKPSWIAFGKDTGTLGIPRAEMPQVKQEHRGALVNFLEARGITNTQATVQPDTLKPTQEEYSPSKVEKSQGNPNSDRAVLVSSDGHVLDGHHQWLDRLSTDTPVRVIRFNAPIKQLLAEVAEFPSVGLSDGATNDNRARAAQDFKGALADLAQIASKHNRAMMVKEDMPDLMPTLVKLFGSAIKVVGTDLKAAIAHVKAAMKADPRLKAFWNKISNELYQKAALQALENQDREDLAVDAPKTAQAQTPPAQTPKAGAVAAAGQAGSEAGAPGQEAREGLIGQSNAEILADQERIAQADKDKAKAKAEKDAAAADKRSDNQKESDRRAADILAEREAAKKAEVDAAGENFGLGDVPPAPVVKKVTAKQKRGQGSVFDAPADTPTPEPRMPSQAELKAKASAEFMRGAGVATTGNYPRAGDEVDGRVVRDHVPNKSSIAASFNEYTVLPGVREVPMSAMDQGYVSGVRTRELDNRTQNLANEIKESGEINPLIVAIDEQGPYILEGGHRFDALIKLGAKSFPAVVVVDKTDAPTAPDTSTPQTETAKFKEWFGDSKVVDANGKPMVVYHGTNKTEGGDAFTMFDAYGGNYGLFGLGAYFTEDPAVSSSYTSKGGGSSPSVYAAYMTLKNPIDMDAPADAGAWQKAFPAVDFAADYKPTGTTNEAYYRQAEEYEKDTDALKYEAADELQGALREMGYDGITHIGGGRVKSEGVRHRVFIAFEPEQIKSAIGNNGNFDPANADIRRSQGATPSASTATAVRAALTKRFGPRIARMERRGFLKVWDSAEQFNKSGQQSRQVEGGTQGMWDGKTAHLFADGIQSGNEVAVMLHEVGEHANMQKMLGPQQYNRLVARAHDLVYADDPAALEAVARIPDNTPEKYRDSELLAYMIETVAAADAKATPGARKWLADMVAAIRAWWFQTPMAQKLLDYGVRMELTPKDIAALAVRAVKWQGGTRLSDGVKTLAEDVAKQEKWLNSEARARGFKDIDDLAEKAYPVFEKLAELWRKKNPAEMLLSRAPANTAQTSQDPATRAETIIQTKAGSRAPLDVLARGLTRITGVEKVLGYAYNEAGTLLDRFTPEQIKAGVISDYGIPEAVIDKRSEMQGNQRKQLRGAGALLEKLATLTRAESRVAYQWMNMDGSNPQAYMSMMAGLPEESVKTLIEVQKLVDELSLEAVRLGQLSPEAYKRNRMAYLRRSYVKHTAELTKGEAGKRKRALSILGDQYKGRGMTDAVDMAQIQNLAPDWWKRKLQAGKADTALKGEKFIRLERRDPSGEGVSPLDGMQSKAPGKLREVVYFPADQALPAKYKDWSKAGTWEVRDTKGGKLVMWRDFTKDEREKMGEIDEARYAIAKTLHAMIHDVEVGRYLEWLNQNYAKQEGEAMEGNVVEASERMLDSFKPDDWVRIPDSKISGTSVLRYGKLAGSYLPGPIWNDLRQVVNGQYQPFGETYANILRAWKISKTALSPTVHMNNVMSNMVIADWHDVSAGHMAKALRLIMAASKDSKREGLGGMALRGASNIGIADAAAAREVMARYQDSGGDIGGWVTNEIRNEQLQPLLDAMEKELAATAGNSVQAQIGVFSALQHAMMLRFPSAWDAFKPTKVGRVIRTDANNLIELYQSEDDVFRLAAWLKAKEEGKTDLQAGKVARTSFLDYRINAPWVQAMRQSAWPFISFTYRAVPMLLETVAKKPHKIMKLMMLAGALNALGVLLSGGDDDEERKLLPEEKAGRSWGMVPKLIRMPWNDGHNSAVYLDIRRFIPVGDIFDLGAGNSAVPMLPGLMPGGPLVLAGEVVLNKSGFTGKPITLETDTAVQKAGKVTDYLYKAFAPNLLGLPGTHATTGVLQSMQGRTDAFGREMSTPQALASSFGVKLGSYPADVLRRNLQGKMSVEIMEIDRSISQLKRQLHTKRISNDEFQAGVKTEQDKKVKLMRELNEKMK